jgi:hypothetical protein
MSFSETVIVSPAAVDVIDVHVPLLTLYSIVLVSPPNAFQLIVPGDRTLNVR